MRVGLVVLLVSVAMGFGQAASAGAFPDLPGMEMAESVAGGASAPTDDATSATTSTTDDERVPAPDPTFEASNDSTKVVDEATSPDQIVVVAELPGGSSIPLIKELSPASNNGAGTAQLAMLALAICVLFTRFLFRLNDVH
jgi:hypothetical protein